MAKLKKSFSAPLAQFDDSIWGFHLRVPEDIVNEFHAKKIKRFNCTINGEHQMPCAVNPHGDGYYFVYMNKQVRKKLALKLHDIVHAELEPNETKYGVPLPEELEELLYQDPEGSDFFHALTPGKQRSLIYLVSKIKSSNLRLQKSLVILDYLKFSGGKLDFKELNEAFKNSKRK